MAPLIPSPPALSLAALSQAMLKARIFHSASRTLSKNGGGRERESQRLSGYTE